MMLQPRSIEQVRLDPARLVRYDAPLDYREGNRRWCFRSPGGAWSRRPPGGTRPMARSGAGDASVVAAVFVDAEGAYWLHGIRYLQP